MHYIFGAWYRGDEIARRGGVFYVGLTLGTLTAGLIQAGASSSLHDVNGLAGWRWMYVVFLFSWNVYQEQACRLRRCLSLSAMITAERH